MNQLQASVLSITLSLSHGVQAYTQQQMIEILLPRITSECTERTKIIIPSEGGWYNALKGFGTCTSPFTITVQPDNTLKIYDGTSVWNGRLQGKDRILKIGNK